MKWVRKALILTHRYLGTVLSLLFVVWFISGIGMIYAKTMPELTSEVRYHRLPRIDLSRVKLTPAEAAERLGDARAGRVSMGAILDRPVYRFGGRGGATIVFADDGAVLDAVAADQAKAIGARFLETSEDKIHYTWQEEVDQWTLGVRRQLPLHKLTVDDDAHTALYVSPESGDVLLLTTRASRALAWVAAIPHWLYFTKLRTNDELWNRVILWASGIGSVSALIGIVLGIIQFRISRPVRLSRLSAYIPYSGLMRWHYISGLIFGVFTLTWVFSGLLSMDPWEWVSGDDLRVSREPFTGGPLDVNQFPPIDAVAWARLIPGADIKEIDFVRIQGEPHYSVRGSDGKRVLASANPLSVRSDMFPVEELLDRLKRAAPGSHIVESQLLSDYDSYYYAQSEERPLPILRAKFDDPKQTWVYVDPMMGQVVGQLHRGDRIQRWLYHGFHSLDFPFWYRSRGVWEVGMIVLSIGGAAVSGIGMWLGFKRVGRAIGRIAKFS